MFGCVLIIIIDRCNDCLSYFINHVQQLQEYIIIILVISFWIRIFTFFAKRLMKVGIQVFKDRSLIGFVRDPCLIKFC